MDFSKMKFLARDIIPCWYEMAWRGWNGEEPAILLRLHNDFVRSIKPIPEAAPVVREFKEKFFDTLFDTFAGSFDGEFFGFNRAFRRRGETGEFVEYIVPIPVIKKPTGKTCPECDGTKEDRVVEDRECLFCDGTGREHRIDWRLAYSISASFTIFTAISEYPEIETSSLTPQLLTFHTITLSGQHGGPRILPDQP